MSTKLDEIIDGASDSTVRITDLLRRTLVLAHRLEAPALRIWVERELSGYKAELPVDLPVYRRGTSSAKMKWNGPMGSSFQRMIAPSDAPDEFAPLFVTDFNQPLSELESFRQAEGDIGIPWPPAAIVRWNDLAAQGKAPGMELMVVHDATTLVQLSTLDGVLDAVRNRLLTLALDLQVVAGDVGESGGTTAQDPKVEAAVTTFITNVYGSGTNVAQGGQVQQTVVQVGDLSALTRAASEVGLDSENTADFIAAVLDARKDRKQGKLKTFLRGVRSGAVSLAGGVASNVAADQLLALAVSFLGA